MFVPFTGAPVYYDYKNAANAIITPSTVHVQNTALQSFFRRYLLQKAISVFKWKLPEGWAANYFLYVLYCWGFIAVINTNKFGVIPQACGLEGYTVMYQPQKVIVTNPLFRQTYNLVIDRDCTLFRLTPDYGGILDLVNYYADLMALCAESVGVNLLNSKLAYVFTADNKAAAESFKKLFDRIASGEPAVVQDSRLIRADGSRGWDAFAQNLGANYIAGDVLSDMRKIEAEFDTVIGIPNANTDKRERLIADEVNANNIETASRCALWLDELQECARKTRDMFGIDISVDWRYNPDMGVNNNALNALPDGDV